MSSAAPAPVRLRTRPTTASAISSQTLPSAGAVSPGIAACAIVAESAAAGAPICLLPVTPCLLALSLVYSIGPVLICASKWLAAFLPQIPTVVIDARIRKVAATVAIEAVGAGRLAIVLTQISVIVVDLRLIVFLVELWGRDITGASVVIEIVRAIVVIPVVIGIAV
jgi:hypothetical protein